MFLKFKIFIYNFLFVKLKWWKLLHFDKLIKTQIENPRTIPIIIINFNQLFYLKKLVDFLLQRKFENIIIIDNLSTYPPLLKYYKTLKGVSVEYMDKNYGHMVFFEKKELQKKYGQGFYVVTDADIVPNENLPEDFMKTLLNILIKEFNNVNKVGVALNIENIPDYFILKSKVLRWEQPNWKKIYNYKVTSFMTGIDTTFAIYKPQYPRKFNNGLNFLTGIRLADNYTAIHGGWYIDHHNLSAEQKYYLGTSSNSNSWKINENGELLGKMKNLY